MSKHVVIISENPGVSWNYSAMYDVKDSESIKLRESVHKTLEKYVGTFRRDESVKGWRNGHELGIFTAENNKEYVVFGDYSVAEYK